MSVNVRSPLSRARAAHAKTATTTITTTTTTAPHLAGVLNMRSSTQLDGEAAELGVAGIFHDLVHGFADRDDSNLGGVLLAKHAAAERGGEERSENGMR